ncbi:hypothetical protein [Bradyrhizobium genomosp. III]|uniref:hypothetical protein n=1 Tax=Bradyrhizobium genomosp. III TaxID=2683271 RepID=UPI001FCBCF7C|nr:hypothetical protein [Bradyrhizobium sp. CCBAU 15615]
MSEDAANGRRPVMRVMAAPKEDRAPAQVLNTCHGVLRPDIRRMQLTDIHDQAIQARMALTVGARTFDRLFAGVRFDKVDGDIPFVYAKDEDTAAKIEDEFALHISIIASKMLEREINIVMVFPRQLVS